MKTRLLFVLLTVATVATLAACGGGPKSVPAGDIALVDSTPITNAQFNGVLAQAESQAKSSGQPVPQIGTPQYTTLKNQIVAYLVQVSELEQQAPKLGVNVTSKDIDAFLTNLAKVKYAGSMKKLEAALKTSGLTLAQAKQEVFVNLTAQKIRTKVTSAAKVTTANEMAYYKTNLLTFAVPAEKTRDVQHILVKTKSLANTLEAKLKAGASFATLAKKYSKDPGSAAQGGKFAAVEGKDVAPYDKVAFSAKVGTISPPVSSTYGWFIIEPLGPVKSVKAHTTPFKTAQASIKQTLISQQQQTLWSTWLAGLTKQYAGKVSYGAGYAPPATTALPTTTG